MKYTVRFIAALLVLVAGVLVVLRMGTESRDVSQVEEPARWETRDAAPPSMASAESAPSSREAPPAAAGRLVSASPGRISGIVVDATDAPVVGATCDILESGPPAGLTGIVSREPRPRKSLASVKSDTNGGFRVDVPPGFWVLRVVAEGRSPWEEAYLQPGDFRWVRLQPARDMTILVRDTAGQPIAGAEVRLLKSRYGDTRQAWLTVKSNGSGAAILESIPAGTWFIHVSHTDHISVGKKLPGAESSIRLFEVVLERGIRIAGRVTLSGGEPPPPGTQVLFETPGGFRSSHSVACDADGRYASRVVFGPRWTLEVAALAPGFGELRRDVYLGAQPDSGVQREDFVLETLERTVVGRVVDPAGLPLAGIEVYVLPLVALPPETLIPIPEDDTPDLTAFDPEASNVARHRLADETDSSGFYRVGGLHPRKSYGLLLVSTEYSNARLWVELALPGATTDLGTTELQAAGRVWGHVRRPDGSPIEGAFVYAIQHSNIRVRAGGEFQTRRPKVLAAGLESTTADSGFFSIQPFPESDFLLWSKGTMFGPYSMPEGGDLELELVTEEVDRTDASRAIRVRLDVVDTLGIPAPRAYAEMTRASAEPDESIAATLNNWLWQKGDDGGHVEFYAYEEGEYDVEVKDLQGLLVSQSFRIDLTAEGLQREVVLAADPSPSAPLEGVVLSSVGEAVAGLDVTLIPVTGTTSCKCLKFTTRTDASGNFSFGFFMRGAHQLVVTDPEGRFPPGHYYPAQPGEPLVVMLE